MENANDFDYHAMWQEALAAMERTRQEDSLKVLEAVTEFQNSGAKFQEENIKLREENARLLEGFADMTALCEAVITEGDKLRAVLGLNPQYSPIPRKLIQKYHEIMSGG